MAIAQRTDVCAVPAGGVVDVPEGVAAQRQYRCGYAVQGDQVCGIDGERQPGE